MDIVRTSRGRLGLRGQWLKKAGLLGALGVVVIGLVAAAWRPSAAATPAVERGSVWTERVKRGDLLRQVPVQGALVPERVQWLSAGTAARVARIAVRPGAAVEPETVVVVLENTDIELAALEAEKQAAAAESRLIELDVRSTADERLHASSMAGLRADLHDADRHAETANRLAPEGLMGENERRDAIARAAGLAERFGTEQARGETLVSGRLRQIAAQQAEIARMREIAAFRRRQVVALEVRAGVRGVVQDIPLENGQWVAIGTLLAKVAEPGLLKAEVKVAESHARDVLKGMAVRFDGAGAACTGHVSRIDPAVVAGTVRLEVMLDAAPAGARVAQKVSGYVEIEKLDNVLYVARPAGVVDGKNVVLFRVDGDHSHATRVNVSLGRGSAREVEVISGLQAGDEVVVSDASSWEASARVRLK